MQYTLLSDGSSDRLLLRPIEWLLEELVSPTVAIQPGSWADLRNLQRKPATLADRIERAIELYPCDILFVHRDAESQPAEMRFTEIQEASQAITLSPALVPVIPIRMQEAWLLFNEQAIREAAGNPRGNMNLQLPTLAKAERRADPKDILHDAIRTASGATGRRLKKLHLPTATFRVAEMIEDFSPLRKLSAFRRFENDLAETLSALQLIRE